MDDDLDMHMCLFVYDLRQVHSWPASQQILNIILNILKYNTENEFLACLKYISLCVHTFMV